MTVTQTQLQGCFIIKPKVFEDQRGYFQETFNQANFAKLIGLDINFVQDNESMSSKGVLRGLHYQTGAYAQAKLVRVVRGKVLDVAVDLRKGSPTFGEHIAVELSAANNLQLFIPRGFAHGFVALEDQTLFSYKCDNFYNKSSEAGIIYNDPSLNIDWLLPHGSVLVSESDRVLPEFKNAKI